MENLIYKMNNSLVSLQSMSNKKDKGDSGLIAEEIINAAESDIIQRCNVVEMSVKDGDFSLPEALRVYNVSKTDYQNYINSKNQQVKYQIHTDKLPGVYARMATEDIISELKEAMSSIMAVAVARPEIIMKVLELISLDMTSDTLKQKSASVKKRVKA
jgi:hypothetical protein